MDEETAKQILEHAAQRLKTELNQFGATIGERPIMFRLAHYIACAAEGGLLSVDCDYNRHGDQQKQFPLLPYKEEDIGRGRKSKRFFPDVVLHQRRDNDHNTLVCEIKRASDPRHCQEDHRRLEKLTCERGLFRYKVGAFVEVDQGTCCISLTYFKNGKQVGEPINP